MTQKHRNLRRQLFFIVSLRLIMKRNILIYIAVWLMLTGVAPLALAQMPMNRFNQGMGQRDQFGRDQFGNQIDPNSQPDNLEDTTGVEIESLPPKMFMWQLSENLGERTIVPVDSAALNFQNSNLVEGMTGHYNYLGNLGTPRISRLFFERRPQEPTIFLEPFSSFLVRPDQVRFTNSNIPFSNLTYYKAGNKVNGEERFKSYFSVNANKRLAFGFHIDYLYGRGYYANQSTAHFNAGLFASYIGKKYQMQAVYNNFFLKMNENGGIADDQYITRPENMAEGKKEYESINIPVRLEQTANRNHNFYVYLTHRYCLGFERETVKITEKAVNDAHQGAEPSEKTDSIPPVLQDTLITREFVPVTSFIHTMKVERASHRFTSGSEAKDLYANNYYQEGISNDSTVALSVKNTFGIALLEGFNKYAKAGLTAYISHKFSRYDLMGNRDLQDPRPRMRYTEQEVFVGGELAKRQGKTLHYKINGEVGILDKALGQFSIHADADLNVKLWNDTVNLYARGFITNTLPSFYMRHYHSNHFYWDNENLGKENRTRVEGELNIARWRTNLKAGVENLKNYTYFNQQAVPEQADGNIQVVSACLKQDFKLGIFHLDNEITWQKSSNETLLPLPDLSLYHNFYLLTKIAKKVLTVQLGADVRYFTEYHAPAYMPAIQQFHLQAADDQVKIGGYPIVNVYLNLHLKRTRIYAMMYHVNAGMGNRNSFLVPHHPINPRLFKIGVSWNFFD